MVSGWSNMFRNERDFKFARMTEELAEQLSKHLRSVNTEVQKLTRLLDIQRGELTSLGAEGNGYVREGFDTVGSKLADMGAQLDAVREQELQKVYGELYDIRKELEACFAQLDAMHRHLEAMRLILEDIICQIPHWAFDLQALCALEKYKQGVRVIKDEDGHPRIVKAEDENRG